MIFFNAVSFKVLMGVELYHIIKLTYSYEKYNEHLVLIKYQAPSCKCVPLFRMP